MTITLLLQNKRLKPNFIIKALGSIKIQIKFTIQYKTRKIPFLNICDKNIKTNHNKNTIWMDSYKKPRLP